MIRNLPFRTRAAAALFALAGITAVSAMFGSLRSTARTDGENNVSGSPNCTLPGLEVVSDPTGDQNAPGRSQVDIQSVSIAELGTDTDVLSFTIKVADLNEVPPNGNWRVIFTPPDNTTYYVSMDTSALSIPTFSFGRISASGVSETVGLADSGTFSPDGTITIKIAKSKVGDAAAGSSLNKLYGETNLFLGVGGITVRGIPVGAGFLFRTDLTDVKTYTVVGNSSCADGAIPTPTPTPRLYTGPVGTISTYAGGGDGDEGLAIEASFRDPFQVAVDNAGNLYINDVGDATNRIRRVDAAGIIHAFAGSGAWDYAGDGGAATQAGFTFPLGPSVDAAGNVYFADLYNQRVRKVDRATGLVTTVAGRGDCPCVIEGSAGGFSGDGGHPSSADLDIPVATAVDHAGNLYIADMNNFRIRKVAAGSDGVVNGSSDEVITTVAGTGENACTFNNLGPTCEAGQEGARATETKLGHLGDITLDASGNLFFSDSTNRIRKVDTAGLITTYAGNGTFGAVGDGGPAALASLYYPSGLDVDEAGNLYFADTYNHRIRKVDATASINGARAISTVAGSGVGACDANNALTSCRGSYSGDGGPATQAGLNFPRNADVDSSGNLYIADWLNRRIRKVDRSGNITTVAGNGNMSYSPDGNPARLAGIDTPDGIVMDAADNLYIADRENNLVRKINRSTGVISKVAGDGYKTCSSRSCEGRFAGDNAPATQASLNRPRDLAFDSVGNLYIADTENHRVRRIDTRGNISTYAGSGSNASDQFGRCLDSAGLPSEDVGDGGQATEACIQPNALVIDKADNVYIGDTWNVRVRKVDASSGIITTYAGTGARDGNTGDGGAATAATFSNIERLALDSSGNLHIATYAGGTVRKVDAAGIITTIAGDPSAGCTLVTNPGGQDRCEPRGDGGPATEANLNWVSGLHFDRTGNLYISDHTDGMNVRRVNTSGIIHRVAGSFFSGYDGRHFFYSGDGGPARKATLSRPNGVTTDSAGNLYIADGQNQRIRKVDFSASASPSPSPSVGPSPSATASPNPTVSPLPSATATPSPSPSPFASASPTATASASATPTDAHLMNISTRVPVRTEDHVGIGGFIIRGDAPKTVIVRAIGPSMNINNVPVAGRLQDPTLTLQNKDGAVIAHNDNWRTSQERQITESGMAPGDDKESAILMRLDSGAYTAIISGSGNSTGIGLVEVFDLESGEASWLGNISTRGPVEVGDDVLIGGFILRGDNPQKILVRAIGPELSNKGVPGALQNPAMSLHDENGNQLMENDNWRDSQEAEIQATGIPPNDDRESAIVRVLSSGNYTAIVRGKSDSTGVGLVEVYNLGNP